MNVPKKNITILYQFEIIVLVARNGNGFIFKKNFRPGQNYECLYRRVKMQNRKEHQKAYICLATVSVCFRKWKRQRLMTY